MLTTYLHGFLSKFIIVEDDLEERSDDLFAFLLGNLFTNSTNVIYMQFNYNFIRNIDDKSKLCIHCDFTKLSPEHAVQRYAEVIHSLPDACSMIIDSLAHMIYKLGARNTYKLLNQTCRNSDIKRILAQLHNDLLFDEDDTLLHIASLSHLHIKIERQMNNTRRLSYTYKKGRGKIVKEMEEFSLTNGELVMRTLTELTGTSLLHAVSEINLHSLTSFNIELSEQDKVNRQQMDLPFLPKHLQQSNRGGQIDYVFDEGDDWDAEDPDDDLDV